MSMSLIKEPEGVDFIIQSPPLTDYKKKLVNLSKPENWETNVWLNEPIRKKRIKSACK